MPETNTIAVRVHDIKRGDHLNLGTLGTVTVLGDPTSVYPFRTVNLAVQMASGETFVLTLPSGLDVRVGREV